MRNRAKTLLFGFTIFTLIVIARLFYWQIFQGEKLFAQAESQYFLEQEIHAPRGRIYSKDKFPLVSNIEVFTVFADMPKINKPGKEISTQISKIVSQGALEDEVKSEIEQKLENKKLLWIPLVKGLEKKQKMAIEDLKISGLGFEKEEKRNYPESSMSAHLIGFVGKDSAGKDKGYFGIEGYYDRELEGKSGLIRREKDAWGIPILIGQKEEEGGTPGRDLTLYLDRGIQFLVEEKLKDGMKRYGAVAGSVVIMDPQTGGIIASASYPNYDQANYYKESKALFSNPVVAQTFEPGSVFKIFIMAAAIDAKVIDPNDRCDRCSGPRKIGEYTIRTWDNKYHPDSSMGDIIKNSDNIGMVFVGEKLGKDRLLDYLDRFGFSKRTGIDLEEETNVPLRAKKDWSEVDLATTTFGQGIAVTPIQLLTAVNVIASGGKLLEPHVVESINEREREIKIKPKVIKQVISLSSAKAITEMMVNAVENGEAKWAKPKGYKIAGKTGTAQIPIAGHYDEEKTITSFVGFAPADRPKFVMLVTLKEPKTSPWGSETAAPLWFSIAKDIFIRLGIPTS